MRIAFLTSTPQNVFQGSGTYTGVSTLAAALRRLGVEVDLISPEWHFPVHAAARWWFNHKLTARHWGDFDLLAGFDLDGYAIAGKTGVPHIASIKGVIADEMQFETGATRLSMSIQAGWERQHVQHADLVMTTSRYAARRLQSLYGILHAPVIVPEAISLEAWDKLFDGIEAPLHGRRFTVLTVCRFYPRKRLNSLLAAAVTVRRRAPDIEFRIVGDGPGRRRLQTMWRREALQDSVRWLGNLSQHDLAREYRQCDVFCLPSVQEGFGIVFLEAMAAGKPIVAANAAAVPEVVQDGVLIEPGNEAALAEALLRLYRDTALRACLGNTGRERVKVYDADRVARQFLAQVEPLVRARAARA
jgi:glycosyltransferase involved in cell wall biosynthesis